MGSKPTFAQLPNSMGERLLLDLRSPKLAANCAEGSHVIPTAFVSATETSVNRPARRSNNQPKLLKFSSPH